MEFLQAIRNDYDALVQDIVKENPGGGTPGFLTCSSAEASKPLPY